MRYHYVMLKEFIFRIRWVRPRVRRPRREYLKYKEQARALVLQKLIVLNESFGFEYDRVSIRNQRSCWGSCSKKGNLNFNYKILFLPPRAQDYVLVHELAHLKEFNHSKDFWALVASVVPEYASLRKELKGKL
jgi:predicted metal-dependent hydrolase